MLQHFWVWVLNLTPHAGHALCLMHSARRSQSRKATTNGGFHGPSEECKGLSVSVIHCITSPVSWAWLLPVLSYTIQYNNFNNFILLTRTTNIGLGETSK
jgi:hypothetical protein